MSESRAESTTARGSMRYRINPDIESTRQRKSRRKGMHAYLKNPRTGRLLKFGARELFLLTQFDNGAEPFEIAESFEDVFGSPVTLTALDEFRKRMCELDVLVRADALSGETARSIYEVEPPAQAKEPEFVAKSSEHRRFQPATDQSDALDDDESFDDDDDWIDDDSLEEMVFDDDRQDKADKQLMTLLTRYRVDDEGEARAAGSGTSRPQSEHDADSADAEEPRFSAQEETGSRQSSDAPKEGIWNPELAAKTMQFKRGGDAEDDELETKPPGMLRLFNPTGILRLLNFVFGWIRLRNWQIVPVVTFGLMILFSRLSQFGLSVETSFGQFNILLTLLISFMTVNFADTVISAMTIQRHGGRVRHFGLTFLFWVVPRFSADTRGILFLDREGKLAYAAAGLKTRLMLFVVAIFVWAVTRSTATLIPDIAFVVSVIALFTFIFMSIPVLPSNGYMWLTTYLEQPMLRERAFNYVFGIYAKKVERFPRPEGRERLYYALYAVGSGILLALGAVFLFINATTAMEGRYGGAGLLMFFGLLAAAGLWIVGLKRAYKSSMKTYIKSELKHRADEVRAGRMEASTALVPLKDAGGLVPKAGGPPALLKSSPLPIVYGGQDAKTKKRNPWPMRLVGIVALGAFAYAMFLPYNYEAGGDFTILPDERTQVTTLAEGELEEIFVSEGNIVEAGDVLARINDLQPRFAVATTEADLERSRAVLDRLRDGAPPEEIQVAREQVALARADLPFKKAQAERSATLLERGSISEQQAESFQSAYVVALQELRTAEANLAKVQAGATENEIRVAESEVKQLEIQLEFHRNLLERANIVSPVSGRVVTENVHLLMGKYMTEGELFLEIEDHGLAQAEVRVTEADIGLVEVADRVRLKAWAASDVEHIGTVVSIAPVAETEEFGRTIRVKTELENEDGFFRPGMTGFAKIEGSTMPTWRAFTRLVDRFFRIEVWGWIP